MFENSLFLIIYNNNYFVFLHFFQQKGITPIRVDKKLDGIIRQFKTYEKNKNNSKSKMKKPANYEILSSFLSEKPSVFPQNDCESEPIALNVFGSSPIDEIHDDTG